MPWVAGLTQAPTAAPKRLQCKRRTPLRAPLETRRAQRHASSMLVLVELSSHKYRCEQHGTAQSGAVLVAAAATLLR